jgi:subtilisin-like proprotein convertase family protein
VSHSKRFMGRLRRATHLRGGLAGRSVAAAMILAPAVSLALSGAGGALAQPTPSGEVHADAVQTFSSTTPISLANDGSNAVPYPSTVVVSGLPGQVIDVVLTLKNINHTNPDDIDVLLVAPDGEGAIVMSDVGGTANVATTNLTLDDSAAIFMPDEGPLPSGTYKSTNANGGDTDSFGSPAPSPTGTDLTNTYDGIDPNGTWKLFVKDDTVNDFIGNINGGFSLKISTTNSGPRAVDDNYQAKAGEKLNVRSPGVLRNDQDPDNDKLTAHLVSKPRKGRLNFNDNGSFTYTPKNDATGTDTFIYQAVDPDGLTSKAKVTIDIKKARG